jgi:E3 ubiquitin-protein ligase MYLIP
MYGIYQGMKASTAEYWLLKEASYLDSFGEEVFHSKPSSEGGVCACLGVGPHGICLYNGEGLAEKLRYFLLFIRYRAKVLTATHISE